MNTSLEAQSTAADTDGDGNRELYGRRRRKGTLLRWHLRRCRPGSSERGSRAWIAQNSDTASNSTSPTSTAMVDLELVRRPRTTSICDHRSRQWRDRLRTHRVDGLTSAIASSMPMHKARAPCWSPRVHRSGESHASARRIAGRHRFAVRVSPQRTQRSLSRCARIRRESARWSELRHGGRLDRCSGPPSIAHSGPGQSLQPMSFGLGGRQAMVGLRRPSSGRTASPKPNWTFARARNITTIAEIQRQLASCPVLFAWNGEAPSNSSATCLAVPRSAIWRHRASYAPPRPHERFPARPRRRSRSHVTGATQIKLAEPMEESGVPGRRAR